MNTDKMFVALLASTLLRICSGHSLLANLRISENGADYNQRVEYDPISKAVTYQVPRHHDILASTVILHKPTVSMKAVSYPDFYLNMLLKTRIPWWNLSQSKMFAI